MTDTSQTSEPTPVPEGASLVGAVRARWAWTAPEVWTERMLTALETGVRGGRWYTLMDKVYTLPTLRAAFARVKANRGAAGVDHVTVAMFDARLETHLAALSASLRDGTYRPQAIRRHWIPKGPRERRPSGFRPCGTGSCKPPCVWSWNRSSTGRLPPQLRLPTEARREGRAAARRRPAARGVSLRRRCGPAGVLRHHPARTAAGAGGVEGQR